MTINGEPHEALEGSTVAELIKQLQLNQRRVAIEVNREIVAREAYATHRLSQDDQIEIVHFVGGG